MGHLLQKIIWKFLKKTKYRIILQSSNHASGYIHKRTKDNYALMFIVALSTRAKSGNTRPSADEGISSPSIQWDISQSQEGSRCLPALT